MIGKELTITVETPLKSERRDAEMEKKEDEGREEKFRGFVF